MDTDRDFPTLADQKGFGSGAVQTKLSVACYDGFFLDVLTLGWFGLVFLAVVS